MVIFGRFWVILGPCPEFEKFGNGSGTSQKGGSTPGDFDQDLDGRAIFEVKNLTEVSSLEGQFWPFWTIFGDFVRFWPFLGRSGAGRGLDNG